jgi:hypothetical protein
MDPQLNQGSGLCKSNPAYPSLESPEITNETSNCIVDYITAGDFVQYRINNGADGVPNLERNVNLGGFQVLARGVEQMQVQYATINGVTADNQPALIAVGNYTTLTTEVRVTLASRTAAGKFQGATTAAQGPMAIRASLSSQASPRIALWRITEESPAPATPRWN